MNKMLEEKALGPLGSYVENKFKPLNSRLIAIYNFWLYVSYSINNSTYMYMYIKQGIDIALIKYVQSPR